MKADVVYLLEHQNYGDDDHRTGWWIMRLTISNMVTIERKPIAQFTEKWNVELVTQVQNFRDYVDSGGVVFHDRSNIVEYLATGKVKNR